MDRTKDLRHLLPRTVGLLLAFCLAGRVSALDSTFDVLLDLDHDATTGCDVTGLPGGTFAGVEQILRSTVATSGASSASVTAVDRRECANPATGTFGPFVPVTDIALPWSVGVGFGTSGLHVIETYFPLATLGLDPDRVRLAVVGTDSADGQDALRTILPGATSPIVLLLASIVEIPTTGAWGLGLLAVGLTAAGWTALRRRRRAFVAVLLIGTGAAVAWAATFVQDGDPSEWTGPPAATDASGDGTAGSEIAALWAAEDPATGRLCFRIDASLEFNQAPTAGGDGPYATNEDATLDQAAPGVLGNDGDTDGPPPLEAVLVSGPAHASAFTLHADGSFGYTPTTNYHGPDSFTYRARDGLGSLSAVTTADLSITSVNDAPAGIDTTVATPEETDYVFAVADFGFTDPNDTPANTLQSVVITTLPGAGSLTLSGSGFAAGTEISLANIAAGNLTFTPATNGTGSHYASFTFQVRDNGGTSGGGIDFDASANTMTINVGGVNDAPTGTDNTVSTAEDTPHTFTAADFGFSDPSDTPANAFQSVVITTLPGAGSLTLSGSGFAAGTEVLIAGITAGNLKFVPAANATGVAYASFTFQVRDDGGTPGGGIDLDPTANTMTVTVTSVNDAPAGTNNAVSTPEDTSYTFAAADFGLTDPNDTPANALESVVITTLPGEGSLTLSGSGFAAGTEISLANITGGNLEFVPGANATGSPYASFTFQVRDNGGTGGGGVDLDASANTLAINVTSANDAPAGTNGSISATEDLAHTFTTTDFGFTDPNDAPANALQSVVITTLPGLGSLTLAGSGFVAGTEVSVANITGGNLKFTPEANANGSPYASFTFQVRDDGGTADGGVDLDPSANALTINVAAINDAPAGTNGTISAFEDTQYTFTTTDFGFTDPNDSPANAFQSVVITTLSGAGSLTLSGSGVASGTEISVANITAGNLKFLAAANAAGNGYASFTFQVRDNGGIGGGGIDLDPTANTLTINVSAINDAPAGTDKTVTGDEDVDFILTTADFGFADPSDTPSNALLAVRIATLPGAGSLTLLGSGVSAGTSISVGNITAGNLKFRGASNAFGSPYASFTFQVQDDGGTGGGGVDLDPSPNTMTINLNPVNDPPTVVNESFQVIGNTELQVDMNSGSTPKALETTTGVSAYEGVLDNDSDLEGDTISVTAVASGCGDASAPFDCTLSDGAVVHVEANGEFSYTPAPGDTDGGSFQYTVTDQPPFGTPLSINGTVTFTFSEMVWYVDNSASAGGNGTSIAPFNAITPTNLADTSGDGDLTDDLDDGSDYLFIDFGNGTASGQSGGLELEASQHLIGEFAGLSIPVDLNGNGSPTVLVTKPLANACSGGPCRPLLDDTVAGAPECVSATNLVPIEIVGLNLAGTNGNAIDWTTNGTFAGSGTLTIADNVVRSSAAEGVDVNLAGSGSFALNLAFRDNTITAGTTGADILENGTGTLTITAFDDNVVSGSTGASGIVVNTALFDQVPGGAVNPVSGGVTVIGQSGDGVTGNGLALTAVSGDLNFSDLDIFSGGTALGASGATGFDLDVANFAGTFVSTAGAAVSLSTLDVDIQNALVTSSTSLSGVSLTAVSGTFSTSSTSSISKSSGSGAAFSIDNAAGGTTVLTSTYPGTISNTSGSGRSILINNADAGSLVTFSSSASDAISDTGQGVSLTSNTGASIVFSADLNLSTGANTAFNANGGGTVTATNADSALSTTTGTALNVANTTIGSLGLRFKSISAGTAGSGPTNGLVLDNTGSSGELQVLGAGTPGSGGTIQKGAIGISLNNTRSPSFSWMQLNDFSDFAIRGMNVNGFTLANSIIGGVNGDDDAANEGSISFDDLTGSASLTNVTVSGGWEDNFRLSNTGGTLNRLTFTNCTFGGNSAGFGNTALNLMASSTAVLNVTVAGSSFTGSRSHFVQFLLNGSSTPAGDFVFTSNNMTQSMAAVSGAGNIFVSSGGNGNPSLTYNIQGNTMRGAVGNAINVSKGSGTGTFSGTIDNNTIGVTGVANSGSSQGNGIAIIHVGGGSHTTHITNNTIRRYNTDGLLVQVGDNTSGGSGTVNATITGNTIKEPDSFALHGLELNVGTTSGDSHFVCASIGGAGALKNDVAGAGVTANGGFEMRPRQRQSTTIRLPGYGGASNDTAAVASFLVGQNTTGGTGQISASVASNGFVNGAACP